MELARLTSRCQLTLPREVRQKLGVKLAQTEYNDG